MRAAADPAQAHAEWVAGRDELVRTHPASPVPAERRSAFAGLRHAPYDSALRFVVAVDTEVEPHRLEVPTATDGVVPFELVGRLHLPLGDLDVWWLDSYGGGVFVPVKDALAGARTYGGGRYLLDTVKGADLGGSVAAGLVVDLNFVYNPSCAYDPAWTCPLAPPGNRLDVPLEAGELVPT
ncbi:DUF1684 domain-containing protein [Jiangella asiatica]|uniref:DUF1684 domain-containing protein n=1 Tax=Jiangella asiatica TaxID=2530372 RepID=UPI00193E6E08|nr:DUF1684 domain-containing protein [Jiangella asiatica]